MISFRTLCAGVLIMTATGEVEFVNRQILDFLGKALEELNSLEMVIHPDDRSGVVDAWEFSLGGLRNSHFCSAAALGKRSFPWVGCENSPSVAVTARKVRR